MTTPRYEYTYRLDRLVTLRDPGPVVGVDVYGHPLYGPSSERRVWAGRMDYSARDELLVSVEKDVTLDRTRFVIRADFPVTTSTVLVDDTSEEWAIDGVSARGRNRFYELAARAVG